MEGCSFLSFLLHTAPGLDDSPVNEKRQVTQVQVRDLTLISYDGAKFIIKQVQKEKPG